MKAATDVAKSVSARALFAYAHAVKDLATLAQSTEEPTKLVLVCRDEEDEARALDMPAEEPQL